MVYWLVCSSTLDRVIDPRSGQIKEYNIGICCFSAKNTIFGWLVGWLVGYMMINATFNNISVISWRSALLVEEIRVITKLPNSEQSYKWKVKTHNYINRQNQSTTGKL